MKRLEGKIAVTAGGNSGIGFATARAFVEDGARAAILGRRQRAVDEAVEQLDASAFSVVDEIRKRFGRLDIYTANAGMNNIEPSTAVSVESHDRQFNTNTPAGLDAVLKHLVG